MGFWITPGLGIGDLLALVFYHAFHVRQTEIATLVVQGEHSSNSSQSSGCLVDTYRRMRSAAPGADIHKTGTIVERLPSDRSGGISIHDSVIVGRDATASGKVTFISMSTDGMQNLCYLLFTREARGLTGYSLGCVLAQFAGAGANV